MKAIDVLNTKSNFAIIGMSDNPNRYSYKIYHKLLDKGKQVYGVNPQQNYFKSLEAINEHIDVAILVVNPKLGMQYIDAIKANDIEYLWIQPGAESNELINKARFLNLKVIESCVLREYKATEIKAVVSDLDETLLGHSKTVSEKDLRAIQTLNKNGIKFVPATGRPFYSIENTLEELDLFGENDYSISYNGGMIHHNRTKSIIKSHTLEKDLANWLYTFGLEKDVCIHVYIENKTYTYNLNEEEKHHIQNFPGIEEITYKNLGKITEPIIKILYQNTNISYLKSIEKEIPQSIKKHLEISYSSNRYLEFNPRNVSKGEAVKALAELLDIKTDQILTIGDNSNDLSMLSVSGVSAAPYNAINSVKKTVTYISKRTYNEDAVSDILKHFKLI